MLELTLQGLRHDAELQIIQADVRLCIGGQTIIDEPLCVDVGMPALAASLHGDIEPDRMAPPEEWRSKPFFICGCGDPECRAYSFRVQHDAGRKVVTLQEVEERSGGGYRVLDDWELSLEDYRAAVRQAGRVLLAFAEGLTHYRPLFPATLSVLRDELERPC